MENNELLKAISEMMDSKLKEVSDNMDSKLKGLSDNMDSKLKGLSDNMDSKFKELSDTMGSKFEEVNKRLDKIEGKQDAIYDEVARTKEDVTDIKQSVDLLKSNMNFVEAATIKNLNDIQSLKLRS